MGLPPSIQRAHPMRSTLQPRYFRMPISTTTLPFARALTGERCWIYLSVEALLGVKPENAQFLSEIDRPLLDTFLSPSHVATAAQLAAKTPRPLKIITDRNLITEYRYGR